MGMGINFILTEFYPTLNNKIRAVNELGLDISYEYSLAPDGDTLTLTIIVKKNGTEVARIDRFFSKIAVIASIDTQISALQSAGTQLVNMKNIINNL